jgi:phosphoribosylamine--glycine ligase
LLRDIAVIGPSKAGAQLEGSKDFAKEFMRRNNIPTAAFRAFTRTEIKEAHQFLSTLKPPYVLKADGLAAGKGVVIPDNLEAAKKELEEMLTHEKFGSASSKVVIEEFLNGIEVSVFILTDGESYAFLPEAKDYKRIGENDTGLNTGGMGAVSPVPFADKEFLSRVEELIVKPTIAGLKKENILYKGFIFIGLMNCGGNPYVIEYNCRMGDPETEVVIPRIKNDLAELFTAVAGGSLSGQDIITDPRTAVTVMLVSGGYPEHYEKGKKIVGLETSGRSLVFHAGTSAEGNAILSAGGRVLAITSFGNTIEEAAAQSYATATGISFDKMYYRKDIGRDLMYLEKERTGKPLPLRH